MGWLDEGATGGRAVNKRELAEILDVSEQTLTAWQDEGMPVAVRGRAGVPGEYRTGDVIRWCAQRELRRAGTVSAFDRLNDIRARREELSLQRDLAQVVLVSDIAPAFEAYVRGVDALLLGIPEKFAQTLELTAGVDGKHQVLADLCDELRNELSDYERCASPAGGATPAT